MKDLVSRMQQLATSFADAQQLFAAIGDENRQSIILALLQRYGGLRVGDLQAYTHLSRPAVSHHIKILKDAGIIRMYKIKTMNYYYISEDEATWEKLSTLAAQIHQIMEELKNDTAGTLCPLKGEQTS